MSTSCLEMLPLKGLIERLQDFSLTISFNDKIIPFRKADELYRCKDRRLVSQEINFVIEGSIFGSVDEVPVECNPGEMLWMQPGIPHSLSWPEGLLYYSFNFEIMDANGVAYTIDQPFLYLRLAMELQHLASEIAWYTSRSVAYREERIQATLLLFFIQIELLQKRKDVAAGKPRLTEQQQAKLYGYLHRHAAQSVKPADLSSCLGYTHHYFAELFRTTFGVSAREWILREKVRGAASQLLRTDHTIARIAYAFGFSDGYYLSRQFKKIMGESPKAYRERHHVYR
jgi:AraC-like DNA-binding protein